MRLAVFGATGRTGVHVVRQALERGDRVRVLARSATKAHATLPTAEGLEVVEGDLLDVDAVASVIAGGDAVVNVAGHVKGAPEDLQQRAIAAILAGMRTHDVRRLVTLTGAGVRVAGDRPKLVDKAFGLALKLAQGAMLADSVAYVEAVRASGTDWTVVRAPRLTDDPPAGTTLRVAPHVGGDTGTKLARADLATFILDEVAGRRYVHRAPVVSR